MVRPAFTLLEVILALGLIIAMMGGVYGYYVTTMRAREAAIRSMRDTLLMRAILEQMAEEIRHITDVVPDGVGFTGNEEELSFIRSAVPDMGAAYADHDSMRDDPKPGLQDLMRITYKLRWDEEEENLDEDGTPVCYGLLRSWQSPIDPNPSFRLSAEEIAKYEEDTGFKLDENREEAPPPVAAELIAPEVKFLRFEYLDGVDWRDRWEMVADAQADGSESGMGEGLGEDTGGTGAGDGTGGPGGSESPTGGGAAPTAGGGLQLGGGGQQQGYVLPQAIRITIGKVKVPRPQDEFDISQLAEEKELDRRTHHPDRWTITVYLRQSDPSQLASRQYGVSNSLNEEGLMTGEQTEGGSR